jgi:hypothetical protein
MAIYRGPVIVTQNLIAYYDFANKLSYPGNGSTVLDVSGFNNTGILTNSPTYSSNYQGIVNFNGSTNYAIVPPANLPYGTNPCTISAWARTYTSITGFSWVFSYGNPSTDQSRKLGIGTSSFCFSGFSDDLTLPGVSTNTWYHLTGVYDGANASLYINGSLATTVTKASWNTVQTTAQIGCGTNLSSSTDYWNGDIAQVLIYNRALTATEILKNYRALYTRYYNGSTSTSLITNGLIIFYNFSTYIGTGNTIGDSSGNNVTAIL